MPEAFARQATHPTGIPQSIESRAAETQSDWSIVASANAAPPANNFLTGLACVSMSDCWAVGTYTNNGAAQALTEHWNGQAWSAVSAPNLSGADGTTYLNTLESVACVSSSDCWAVGSAYTFDLNDGSTHVYTLTEHWDGTTWSLVSSPNTASSTTDLDYLYGVSCVSASNCWAVGAYTNTPVGGTYQTLIEHYDGTAWTIVSSANSSTTQTNFLSGVSCVSATACWAVGYNVDTTGQFTLTLIEQWNGSSWAIVTSANASLVNSLESVSCASTSDCQAVGSSANDVYGGQTLIEHWNGTLWSVELTSTDITQQNQLDSVTCNTASDCWAVGNSTSEFSSTTTGQSLIEHYNGTSWSVVASTSPGVTDNPLLGVTCTASSQCFAVGREEMSSASDTSGLIEQWNGSAWATTAAAAILAPVSNELYGISCLSDSNCWAAGYSNSSSGLGQTLIEQWDGTSWAIVSSPNSGGITQSNMLSAINCVASSDCWAVGGVENSSLVTQTLIEHWNGTAWTIISSPNTSTTLNNTLASVSCVSSSDCWAVGTAYTSGNVGSTLIEQWNGTAWSIVTSPNTSSLQSNGLESVACLSSSACWAVGDSNNGSAYQTLIEQWNGTAWSIVSSPDTGAALANVLYSVACASTTECWAVGYGDVSASTAQTLFEHWDGSSWTIVTSPTVSGSAQNYLDAVTCASASDCRGVGLLESADKTSVLTLIEHYDGSSWTIDPSPAVSGLDSSLYAVACVSSADCWTTGSYVGLTGGYTQTLIERDASGSTTGGSTTGGTTGGTTTGGTTTADGHTDQRIGTSDSAVRWLAILRHQRQCHHDLCIRLRRRFAGGVGFIRDREPRVYGRRDLHSDAERDR
jgi:hypothetical protein